MWELWGPLASTDHLSVQQGVPPRWTLFWWVPGLRSDWIKHEVHCGNFGPSRSGEEQEAGEGLMIHPSPVRCAFKHPSQWRSKKLRRVIRTGLHWLTGDICLFRCFFLQTSEKLRPPRLSEGLKQPADWFLCEGRRVFTKSRGCGASALSREASTMLESFHIIKISFTKMEEGDVIKNQRCSKLKPEE